MAGLKRTASRRPHHSANKAHRLTTNADSAWSFTGLPARLRAVLTGTVVPDITSGRTGIIARLLLVLAFVLSATVTAQEHEHASECAGFVVGRGTVNAAAHEWEDGSFNLSEVTITMPRGAVALLRAKDLDGQDAELVLRQIPQRSPERLNK